MQVARSSAGVWVKDAEALVEGDPRAEDDRSTWESVAVLEVHPRGVPFHIGWRTEQSGKAEFYREPAETHDAKLAMGLGDQDVIFMARPLDGVTQLTLELVEVTMRDNPAYKELPLY